MCWGNGLSRRLALAVTLAAGLASAGLAEAKSPAEPTETVVLPESLAHEVVRALVARLSDDEIRGLLQARLDRAAAPPGAAAAAFGLGITIEDDVTRVRQRLGAVLGAAPGLPASLGAAVQRFSEGGRRHQLLLVAGFLAVMLAIGAAAEWLVRRALGDVRRRLEEGGSAAAGGLLIRVVLELLLITVFGAAAVAVVLVFYHGHESSRELIGAVLVATIQVRLAGLAAGILLAPAASGRRLLPFDDGTARRLHRGVLTLAVIFGLASVARDFLTRWGDSADTIVLVMTAAHVLFLVVFLSLVWRERAAIAAQIRGEGTSPLRRILADLWPVLMTAYAVGVVMAAIVEQLDHDVNSSYTGILSLAVVVALPLVDMVLCWLVDRRPRGGAAGPRTIHASYVPVLRQAVHIAVSVGGLLVIASLWGIDLFALTARRTGERLAGDLIDIAVTLVLAYLAWHFVKTEIGRRLAPAAGPGTVGGAGEPGGTGASRLHTLLPLLRGCLLATICVMAALIVLSEFGVQIAPLLAGAGVVGLAVGFGAQTLVRDVISGAFYLMDDAFRLGEYIDVGDAKGTVEKIGIRSMQLRHQRGALNIVPYGTIRRLNNQSRDWVIEQLEFRVTYDSDITKVNRLIKRIGQELMADPELGSQMLQPLKSQGVMAMEDNALLVKAKFMTKPGEQFGIRREAYQRIKQAFDENGIKFAYRQVTVHVPPGGGGPQASAVATAAAGADEGTATVSP